MTVRDLAPFIAAAVVLLVFIVGWMLRSRHERRRSEQMAEVAAQLGLRFEPDDPGLVQRLKGHLPLFSRGRGRRARDVMSGTIEDLEIRLIEKAFTVVNVLA